MGDVLAGMMKNKASGATHGMPAPQVPQLADPSSLMGSPSVSDYSQQGQSQALGGNAAAPPPAPAQGVTMSDLSAQLPSSAPAPTNTDRSNPYAPMADTPQEVAGDIGNSNTPGGTPTGDSVTVTGDAWKPKQEGTLAKIADTLFMLKGHSPIFQQRTDQANMESAMAGFQEHPEQSIARVAKFDPDSAWKMYDNLGAIKANTELEQQRLQARQDQGRDRLGAMLTSIQNNPNGNPDQVYTKQLPLLRQYAKTYNLSPEETSTLLPDKYDADAIRTAAGAGVSAYDQARLKAEGATLDNTKQYQATEIDLRKMGLKIEAATSLITASHDKAMEGIAATNAATSQGREGKMKDNSGSSGPRPVMDWHGNQIGTTNGRFATIVRNGKKLIFDVSGGLNHAIRRPDLEQMANP